MTHIRPLELADLPELKSVIDATGLFPSNMLDDMTADYFGANAQGEHWLTSDDDKPIAIAYVAPERMTEGTWNMLLIAVHPNQQGKGVGSSVMAYAERILTEQGARVLLVETSGLPEYESTRSFYEKCGYEREARIRDFYQAGEDKIIFRKALG
jgi:ribosomal protein S18 acetylase RimI-like enzyme